MADCARELVYLQTVCDLEVRACHLAGSVNRVADLLSRWHLCPSCQDRLITEIPLLKTECQVIESLFESLRKQILISLAYLF